MHMPSLSTSQFAMNQEESYSRTVNKPLLTAKEAARFLRIHWKTVQELAHAKHLPGFKCGRLWRFRQSDLDYWVEAQISNNCATTAYDQKQTPKWKP
jgi:excisionase family DNA binding protein